VERLLLRILGPRADLEDLVQTVFLETCRALPGFRGDSALSTFIGGITVRVARRAMRPSAWTRRRAPMSDEPPSLQAGPEREAVAQEQLRRVRTALERLAPKKRVAFMLWAFEGLSVQEVAETTGHSVSATRSQIYYAQKELRARAQKDPYLVELLQAVEK
jgi:RNA polymerase sigma-70 factor (ECF subfamily)